MAKLIGALAMSHAPQLIMPPEKWPDLPARAKGPFNPKATIASEITPEAHLARAAQCKAAIAGLREKLEALNPDAVIVFGDDQHENIFDDNMSPFCIYTAEKVAATEHFLYLGAKAEDQMTHYDVPALAGDLLHQLWERDFDLAWSRETRDPCGLGHAFGRALKFLMPTKKIPIVPIMVNTYYPPAPSARRCLRLGEALRASLEAIPGDQRIVLLASGGLSHTVIDESFDHAFIGALYNRDVTYLESLSADQMMYGTSEIRNWIILSGAMPKGVSHVDYIPCYRNADGVGCAMGFASWS
jgi:aromatic ring-opening dioxygenase catalytic subunit (LigB family)